MCGEFSRWRSRHPIQNSGGETGLAMTLENNFSDTLVRIPRLNEEAPDFHAPTTHGERRLSDYQGRWLILFSHPADFTPVCTTEFVAFATAWPQFQALNCELLGLSIDSKFSHVAWARNIKEKFGVEIPFPIIDDLSMEVASAYGMIMPGASDTSAVRTTFFIDPESVLRAMVYYPMSNGRNIDEFLRLLKAMQTSDHHKVVTPAGWQPGDDVIVPPPQTTQEAEARVASQEFECKDWYFCTRALETESTPEPS